MSGFGSRPTAAPLPVADNRRALAEALLGFPARVGQSFGNMANAGLAANEAFLQGRGTDGEDMLARPFLPGADTGGRLGALASFLNSNMALGGPAGSLGAGISTEGRGSTAANVAARAANALPMDEASRMARAAEQRFTERVYKGMTPYTGGDVTDWKGRVLRSEPLEEITQINRPSQFPSFNKGEPGVNIAGFVAHDPKVANRFADAFGEAAVYPMMMSPGRQLVIDAKGAKAGNVQFGESGKPFRDAIRSGNYDTIKIVNTADEGDISVVLSPKNLRSRFAAFDPARRNEADLLASYGPNPLSAALLGYQPQE